MTCLRQFRAFQTGAGKVLPRLRLGIGTQGRAALCPDAFPEQRVRYSVCFRRQSPHQTMIRREPSRRNVMAGSWLGRP